MKIHQFFYTVYKKNEVNCYLIFAIFEQSILDQKPASGNSLI